MSKKKFEDIFQPASGDEIDKRQDKMFPIHALSLQGYIRELNIIHPPIEISNLPPVGDAYLQEAQIQRTLGTVTIVFQMTEGFNIVDSHALVIARNIESLLIIKTHN